MNLILNQNYSTNVLIFPEMALKFVHAFYTFDDNTALYKSLLLESSGLKMIMVHADIFFMLVDINVSTNIMIFYSFTQVSCLEVIQ